MSQLPMDSSYVPPRRSSASPQRDAAFGDARPILLVDDSDIDLLVACKCYERSALRNPLVPLHGAGDLLQYLEQLRASRRPSPALILLDVDMPGLDGPTLTARLRLQEGFAAPLCIMLFSHVDDDDMENRAHSVGADAFAPKPSTVDGYVRFFNTLAEHWEHVVLRDRASLLDFTPAAVLPRL